MSDDSLPTDLSAEQMTELLDSIPGAWDRAQEGLREARAGRVIALDDLARVTSDGDGDDGDTPD